MAEVMETNGSMQTDPPPPIVGDNTPMAVKQEPVQTSSMTPAEVFRSQSKTPAPPQREQREKKESLKKREATGTGSTTAATTSLGKRKAHATHAYPSPQRYNVPPPRPQDYEAPRPDMMQEHEPNRFLVPKTHRELYKPMDLAENKRGYRYQRAIADQLFAHKQYYRSTSPAPHNARMSFEDADRYMHFTTNALMATNEKGWRMARANTCAREGTLYYEIKVHRGVPETGPDLQANGPQPFVRFGFARREAPLDSPVGFDGYSYGITDIRCEPMHRSRPSKLYQAKKPPKSKAKTLQQTAPVYVTLPPEDQNVKEGDVIGLEIQLPSLALHQKIVTGVYNPAVDIDDGFTQANAPPVPVPDEAPLDVIRDRIPVAYKGNTYFEILDHVATRPMEVYADRTTNLSTLSTSTSAAAMGKDAIKAAPNPNHEQPALRTLPHSAIRIYKNGQLLGTAFENLLAFLPPASQPSKAQGARDGAFDDGLTGYFPAVSCFFGGIVEMNFGDLENFWAPPEHIEQRYEAVRKARAHGGDGEARWMPGRQGRGVGERYREQVAEDAVFDLVDEVDFFMQDGGVGGVVGSGGFGDGNGGN
ncbi:hypothetical protein B0A48_01310 [Cryoendolithus antarcticus]|uniref:SPRY domain-containing protein n=1 Tax=Cryoendolithus antarcticus TaxID=1507870 RepID=A0A1V8TSV1_9PEZI|nr:hypothetical protein B0A48_01310 [Cryoendolithus antarcticus]